MELRIIEERIKEYKPKNKVEELNALKEIAQEIILSALSRAEFFKYAAFQGGTCLRIVHGLNRFSEDMDFVLYEANPHFKWRQFSNEIELEFSGYGFNTELVDKSKADDIVKKAFLKNESFGQVIKLIYDRNASDAQVIKIKLEIDTNPPTGSTYATNVIHFPEPFSIVTQDIPSLLAGKIHALLCREYVKGRDWYDLVWYFSKKPTLNLSLLQNALFQLGPWKNEHLNIDNQWVATKLKEKADRLDWESVKKDVQPFLREKQLRSLDLWDKEFINECIIRLLCD